jgi:septum formation protein
MKPRPTRFVLGSRSPRRLELLSQIVPRGLIDVLPPTNTEEAGFENLHGWPAIENRLREIARHKCDDVLKQWQTRTSGPVFAPNSAIIAADTIVVVRDAGERLLVLGQPPADDTWADTVCKWFRDYYAGRTHWAVSAVCVALPSGKVAERVVRSEVTFVPDVESRLEWYIATEEPRGKAGGYALQGAGSIFISRVEGSLSNVVGLPLAELMEMLDELGIGKTYGL